MIEAEVTAEKRPACDASQHARAWVVSITYEYWRRVQILVMFLQEFPIIVLSFVVVVSIEFAAEILRS